MLLFLYWITKVRQESTNILFMFCGLLCCCCFLLWRTLPLSEASFPFAPEKNEGRTWGPPRSLWVLYRRPVRDTHYSSRKDSSTVDSSRTTENTSPLAPPEADRNKVALIVWHLLQPGPPNPPPSLSPPSLPSLFFASKCKWLRTFPVIIALLDITAMYDKHAAHINTLFTQTHCTHRRAVDINTLYTQSYSTHGHTVHTNID